MKYLLVLFLVALLVLTVNADKSIEGEVKELKELFGESNSVSPSPRKSTPKKAPTASDPTDEDYDQLNALAEQTHSASSASNLKEEIKLEKAGKDYVGDGLGTPKKLNGVPTKAQTDAMYYGTALGMAGLIGSICIVGALIGLLVAYIKKRRAIVRKETSGDLYQAM